MLSVPKTKETTSTLATYNNEPSESLENIYMGQLATKFCDGDDHGIICLSEKLSERQIQICLEKTLQMRERIKSLEEKNENLQYQKTIMQDQI